MSIQQLHTEIRKAVSDFARREGATNSGGQVVYDGHSVNMALLNVVAEVIVSAPAEHRISVTAFAHQALDDLIEKKSLAASTAKGSG